MTSIKTQRNRKLDYNDLPQKRLPKRPQLAEPQRCGSNFESANAV